MNSSGFTNRPVLAAARSHPRLANLMGFIACAGLLGYAYFSQYVLGLEPCPLCIFQRVAILALGSAFAIAALLPPVARWSRWLSVFLLMLSAASAIGIAGRHLYIQSLPAGSVPACGASLDFLMDVFPLMDVLRKVLTGSGECSKIDWSFLGITMPGWVLISAVVLLAYGLWVNWPRKRISSQ